FTADQAKQRFRTFDFDINFFNGPRNEGDINYLGALQIYRHTDNFDAGETGMLFKIQGQKWFADKYLANLELGTDLTKYSGLIDHSLNLFYLKPNFTYRNDIFKIKAGINLVSQQDEFNIFPDISTSINVFGTKFTIFGGWEGGVQKNTFRQMTTFNPYLISNLDTLVATSYNRYYGGVKGIYRIFNYELQGGFKAVKNLALYLNDDTDTRRFRPLFDDANIVYFKASAGATITKGLTFLGTISQSVFDMKQERGAWHLPSLEGSAGLAYKTLSDKLSVKADVFFADGAPYKGTDGSKKRTNPLVDVNIGGDFWILENVGAFLQVNNLLNIKYQRWNNYPNYGINILGGVVARF
ncbi:MAG: hypothetical protein KA974_11780, partial [Saprospiraceae bacterium]|nr:hypothetical protein [Saprospiraceae bacterium]